MLTICYTLTLICFSPLTPQQFSTLLNTPQHSSTSTQLQMRHAMMEFDWTLTKSLLQQYLDTQQQQQQHGLQAHHAMHVSDESVVRALTRETDMIKRAIDVGLASDGLLHCLQNEVRITGTNFEFKYIFSYSHILIHVHTCSCMFSCMCSYMCSYISQGLCGLPGGVSCSRLNLKGLETALDNTTRVMEER